MSPVYTPGVMSLLGCAVRLPSRFWTWNGSSFSTIGDVSLSPVSIVVFSPGVAVVCAAVAVARSSVVSSASMVFANSVFCVIGGFAPLFF